MTEKYNNIPSEIIDRYLNVLYEKGNLDYICNIPGDETNDFHLGWMLISLNQQSDFEKDQRWLGFIQGVMTMKGYINVHDEREFTRGKFYERI